MFDIDGDEEEKRKRKGRKLFDLDIDEITICGSAASRKKFYIQKQEEKMEEFIEELKKFMAEDDEELEGVLSEEDIEKAEKLSDAAMKAIKGSLNILNKYKADMPDDILVAMKNLARYAAYGYPAKKEEAGGEVKKGETEDKWKSLGMTGDQSEVGELIAKMAYLLKDDLALLKMTKDGIKTLGQKQGIEGHGGGSKPDPDDKWPSLGPC